MNYDDKNTNEGKISESEFPVENTPEETPVKPTEAPDTDTNSGDIPDTEPVIPSESKDEGSKPSAPKFSIPGIGSIKLSKKVLTIGAAAIAAVVIIIIIASSISSPLSLVKNGFDNTVSSLNKNEIVSLLTNVADGGSIEVACDLEDISESLIGYGVDGNASVKLYCSDSKAAMTADIEIDKDLSVEGTLIASKDEIVLSSELLPGSKAYGINLKNVKKNFESSVFGPDGEYSLGLDEDEMNAFFDALNSTNDFSKDAKKVISDLTETLLKSVQANSEIEKSKTTLTFGDNETKVTAVTITMNAVEIGNIASDVLEYMNTDDSFRSAITEYITSYYTMSGYRDPEGMVEDFFDNLEETADYLEKAFEVIDEDEINVDVVFYITSSGSYLVGVETKIDVDGDVTKISAYAGPSFEQLSEISFKYQDRYDDVRVTYTVSTNDRSEYSAKLRVRIDGNTAMNASVKWDKKEGDLSIGISDDRTNCKIDGSLTQKGKATTLSIDSYSINDYEIDLGVDVILTTSDKMPSTPKYTDVLTMKEDDFEDLLYDIEDAVDEMVYYLW